MLYVAYEKEENLACHYIYRILCDLSLNGNGNFVSISFQFAKFCNSSLNKRQTILPAVNRTYSLLSVILSLTF